jgi:uncharacterized protein (UPF0332 family)
LTSEGKESSAELELELADEELGIAEMLAQAGHHRVALARSYFAVFHAVRARLFAEGLEPKTHAGVQHLWNLHLVKPGIYDPSTTKLLARLQKFREEADYAQAFVVDEASAREEITAASELVGRIRRELA